MSVLEHWVSGIKEKGTHACSFLVFEYGAFLQSSAIFLDTVFCCDSYSSFLLSIHYPLFYYFINTRLVAPPRFGACSVGATPVEAADVTTALGTTSGSRAAAKMQGRSRPGLVFRAGKTAAVLAVRARARAAKEQQQQQQQAKGLQCWTCWQEVTRRQRPLEAATAAGAAQTVR